MGWTLSVVSLIVFGSAVLALLVGIAALRNRPDPMAMPLAALMFVGVIWAVPHAISFGFSTFDRVFFWHRLQFFGSQFAAVVYLWVALRYADRDHWLTPRVALLLSIVPAVTIGLVLTDYSLYWESVSITSLGRASILVESVAPWYWVNLVYLYIVSAAGLAVLGAQIVWSSRIYRKQATVMFLGGAVPLATNVGINVWAAGGPTVDLTTAAIAVSGVLFGLALYQFDLLEVRPVARDHLVDELDDGVVVVGPEGRIRDFNGTAAAVLEDIAVEAPAGQVLPEGVKSDEELAVTTGSGRRVYDVTSSPLVDSGDDDGCIIYLHDVTDLVRREQRLSVLNRVLRHNVRNQLTVASGHLETLARRTSGHDAALAQTALDSVWEVIDHAEKARDLEGTVESDGSVVDCSLEVALDRTVQQLRADYPDAAIERTVGAREGVPMVTAPDTELLERAVAELVENGIEHNDSPNPTVTIGCDCDEQRVRLRVADDGPGLPTEEAAVLSTRSESPLEHGSGLGLWLVKWTAELCSGDLSFEDNEPRGTVAVLTLPRAGG